MTVTGADFVRLDEDTDVREVIGLCDQADCEELTRQLEAGDAEIVGGELRGWGREYTLRDENGAYYHVDLDTES